MKQLVPDELWELIEPLLPKHKPSKFGGRPRVDDRTALTAIMFVLKTGIPWEDLPQELGCSGMTAWRRLKEWNDTGVWLRLHQKILHMLEDAGKLDWRRAAINSSSVRAMRRGSKTGKNPTDRAKYGSKRHLLTDANGVILSASVTSANRHDATQAKPLGRTGRACARGTCASSASRRLYSGIAATIPSRIVSGSDRSRSRR